MDKEGELTKRLDRRISIAKMLYGWDNKKFNREYWGQLKINWKRWKSRRIKGERILKTI